MGVLWFLFMVGAIVTGVLIFFGMLGSEPMPFSCPRCAYGGDEDLAGRSRSWYVVSRERVRCRSCYTWFKEHPNGMLVEDRDG
jgi:hypothetical protein